MQPSTGNSELTHTSLANAFSMQIAILLTSTVSISTVVTRLFVHSLIRASALYAQNLHVPIISMLVHVNFAR